MPDNLLLKLEPFKEAVKKVLGASYVRMVVYG